MVSVSSWAALLRIWSWLLCVVCAAAGIGLRRTAWWVGDWLWKSFQRINWECEEGFEMCPPGLKCSDASPSLGRQQAGTLLPFARWPQLAQDPDSATQLFELLIICFQAGEWCSELKLAKGRFGWRGWTSRQACRHGGVQDTLGAINLRIHCSVCPVSVISKELAS